MSDVLKIVGVIALVVAIKRRIDGLEQRVVELEKKGK